MDFTEIYKQSASLVAFSPGTHFLLTAIQDRLVVRRADSFQIARSWALDPNPAPTAGALSQTQAPSGKSTSTSKPQNPGGTTGETCNITHAAWSCDAEHVLGACARRGVVEVFKMRDETWRARIDAGAEGLVNAEWAPDGRSVVCFSEWGVRAPVYAPLLFSPVHDALRVTVWSLVTGTATYIQFPAQPERGHAWRADGHYFLLAERHKSRDTLGVYDATAGLRLVRHFPLPTASLAALALSPTGTHVAVWEGPLEHKLHVLSLAGTLLGTFAPTGDADPGFGVRAAVWHPSGLFLAVMGYDDKVHILESLTWGPIATLELQARVPTRAIVWREPDDWLAATHGRGFLSYERLQTPLSLALPRAPDRTKPPPLAAPSAPAPLAFNTDGTLLLVRFAGAPAAVHLFDFPSPTAPAPAPALQPRLRTVLQHARPVACAAWNPVRRGSLALCCGAGGVYLWSDEWAEQDGAQEELAECVGVPAKRFDARALRWAPDGRGLVLLDRDTFCCAFEVDEGGEGGEGAPPA
ncbi:YVTN repeat-like/Quino protein amine dehydrogenase [Amylocystis lapponica]|nr:YVTN repeat-like/Quino protein amine dehydrogenase [Amylocystis lapponica]